MNIQSTHSGQALTTLIVFVAIATTLMSGLVSLGMSTIAGAGQLGLSNELRTAAQSGIELAKLSLLRDATYSGGTFTLNGIPVTMEVSGSNPMLIRSRATLNQMTKELTVTASMSATGTLTDISVTEP